MIGVVEVRELDYTSDEDGDEIRSEGHSFLRHLRRRVCDRLRGMVRFQINDRGRGIRGRDGEIGLIALIDSDVGRRLRELHSAFYRRLC